MQNDDNQAQRTDSPSSMPPSNADRQNAPHKSCKKCQGSIPATAKKCPLCGSNQNPFYKRAWFWILIVLILIIVMIGGCTAAAMKAAEESLNTLSSNNSSSSLNSNKAAEKYSIADEALSSSGYGIYKISGTFTNLTDKEINYVSVSYTLHDSSGAQIGTALANTTKLAANGTWKFEASGYVSGDKKVVSFKRTDVTGF